MRCLGIPCRPVNNYESARDIGAEMGVHFHVDQDGRPIKKFNEISAWSYHVWNDIWMQRPDLPAGYGDWQVLDVTPKPKSDDNSLSQFSFFNDIPSISLIFA